MKLKRRNFLLIVIFCIVALNLSSCKKTPDVENAVVEFWTSSDGGKTYSKDVFEHPGFGSVYLKLKIQIQTNQNKASFHPVTLSIGESEHIDARIVGGSIVNHRINFSETLYDFTARGIKNNSGFTELYVEFMSYGEGRIGVSVTFDSSVPEGYDKMYTLNIPASKDPSMPR